MFHQNAIYLYGFIRNRWFLKARFIFIKKNFQESKLGALPCCGGQLIAILNCSLFIKCAGMKFEFLWRRGNQAEPRAQYPTFYHRDVNITAQYKIKQN